jgi:PIN domain nuclease of toxin-antitoxin system
VILLDTNALIWLESGHRRARPLRSGRQPIYISPISLLEIQFAQEAGRLRVAADDVLALAHDDRWLVDEPPVTAWIAAAAHLSWTRDPFDRLLAAHAEVRGWRLATADAMLLEHLGPRRTVAL